MLTELKDKETTAALYDDAHAFDEFGELVGLEKRYADEARLRDLTGRAEAR